MIKSALSYIVGLSQNEMVEVDGRKYSTKNLVPVNNVPEPAYQETTTLTGIIDWLGIEQSLPEPCCFCHVVSPNCVEIKSILHGEWNQQFLYLQAVCKQPDTLATGGIFQSQEDFVLFVQTRFEEGADKKKLLAVAGNLASEGTLTVKDDGVTQNTTVKTGIARKEQIDLPNPVSLRPYLSFPELYQPTIQFIFRLKRLDSGEIKMKLVPMLSPTWEAEMMADIAEFLKEKAPGIHVVM